MAADARDPAMELERYREYLRLLVRVLCSRHFQHNVDLSGVVQDTMLQAWQARERFGQLNDDDRAAWLRTVLLNNLRDAISKLQAQRRDVGRERSLEAALDESSARLEGCLRSSDTSPSDKAIRNEELLRLAEALGQLPPDQHEAIVLHRLQGRTLVQAAAAMGKTKDAVAKLVQRGLANLHKLLTVD